MKDKNLDHLPLLDAEADLASYRGIKAQCYRDLEYAQSNSFRSSYGERASIEAMVFIKAEMERINKEIELLQILYG